MGGRRQASSQWTRLAARWRSTWGTPEGLPSINIESRSARRHADGHAYRERAGLSLNTVEETSLAVKYTHRVLPGATLRVQVNVPDALTTTSVPARKSLVAAVREYGVTRPPVLMPLVVPVTVAALPERLPVTWIDSDGIGVGGVGVTGPDGADDKPSPALLPARTVNV